MKKFMNKKYTDMTVGESIKFTVFLMTAVSAVYLAIWWAIIKIDEIVDVLDCAWTKIKSVFSRKKKWVTEEDEEA